MTFNLRVLSPDKSVFDGVADEVILPSTSGQMGILTGHVSMLTALDDGVLRIREGNAWQSIALMGGFAEVDANEVTVLVNGAELARDIDSAKAEKELEAAIQAAASLENQPTSSAKVKALQALSQARVRVAATKAF
ncbi:ATP synthase epsilon chain [Cyanobium sp.]|jgi:F-type H+-transporting ATPase subunit epsilon|nr:ATP synthase epsilon chain [Cyanobium sp.]